MDLDVDSAALCAVYLMTLRLGALLLMTPVFSSLSGLLSVRLLFVLTLSAALVAGLGGAPGAVPPLGQLVLISLAEVATGAVLGFGVFAAFGAFSVAGKILDIQSGFALGSVYDPVTRAGAPLFSTMLNLLGVLMFFVLDGHHAMLRGIAFSLQQAPLGGGFPNFDADAPIRQFGLMFSLGVSLIAPVMVALFLIEVALALLSRVLPQMNVFVVGVPVKIVAALALLALTLRAMGPGMARVYASIFHYWEQVLPA